MAQLMGLGGGKSSTNHYRWRLLRHEALLTGVGLNNRTGPEGAWMWGKAAILQARQKIRCSSGSCSCEEGFGLMIWYSTLVVWVNVLWCFFFVCLSICVFVLRKKGVHWLSLGRFCTVVGGYKGPFCSIKLSLPPPKVACCLSKIHQEKNLFAFGKTVMG